MQRRDGTLLVGPVSEEPGVGGIENGIALLLKSPLAAQHRLAFFNTYRTRSSDRSWHERIELELSAFARFAGRLRSLRPQVVHVKVAEGANFFQGLGYVLTARAAGASVLLQIHGGAFDRWYESLSPLGRVVVRLGLRAPNSLIVLSEYWRSVIARLSPRKQIHVIPNGVDLSQAQAAHRLPGLFRVLTIGAIGTRKGYFDILKAARLLRGEAVRFQFVGPDEYGGEREAIRRTLAEQDLAQHVEILGPVTGADKWRLLAEADCFLLPSRNENMPNSVLEAMAAGLPIICTEVGAIREMVDGTGARFIPVGDPPRIAAAVRALMSDATSRETMGRANRERVAERYALERVLLLLNRVYSEVKV